MSFDDGRRLAQIGAVFRTGSRVPVTGVYVDQHGNETVHREGGVFPPCISLNGGRGEPAHRVLREILLDRPQPQNGGQGESASIPLDPDPKLAQLKQRINQMTTDPAEAECVDHLLEEIDAIDAAYRAGCTAQSDGDYDAAVEAFRRAAGGGHPEAAYELAALLLHGRGAVAIDTAGDDADERLREAAMWLLEAVNAGAVAPDDLDDDLQQLWWIAPRITADSHEQPADVAGATRPADLESPHGVESEHPTGLWVLGAAEIVPAIAFETLLVAALHTWAEHTRSVEWPAGSYRRGTTVAPLDERQLDCEVAFTVRPSPERTTRYLESMGPCIWKRESRVTVNPQWPTPGNVLHRWKRATVDALWDEFPGDREHMSHLLTTHLFMLVVIDGLADEAIGARPTKALPPDPRKEALRAYLDSWTRDDVKDLGADAVGTGDDGRAWVLQVKNISDRRAGPSDVVIEAVGILIVAPREPEGPPDQKGRSGASAADVVRSASAAVPARHRSQDLRRWPGDLRLRGNLFDDRHLFVAYSLTKLPSGATGLRQFTAWFDRAWPGRLRPGEAVQADRYDVHSGELVEYRCPVAACPQAPVWVPEPGGELIICVHRSHRDQPMVPREGDTRSGASRSR